MVAWGVVTVAILVVATVGMANTGYLWVSVGASVLCLAMLAWSAVRVEQHGTRLFRRFECEFLHYPDSF